MPYTAQINRANPSCFIFLIDQSGSMQDVMDPTNIVPMQSPYTIDGRTYTHTANGRTKASVVSDALNRFLMNLVLRCTREDGVRDYFDIGVIGYGGQGSNAGAASAFGGNLAGKNLVPLSDIGKNPIRVEEKSKKVEDGAGGLVNQKFKIPIWLEPLAHGGTPMAEGFQLAKDLLDPWVQNHPDCFPPIIINITDGEWTGEEPNNIVSEITNLSTSDGNVLVFNIHISADGGKPNEFPSKEDELTNDFAKQLFRISSVLPAQVTSAAKLAGYAVNEFTRGFVFNADMTQLVQFIDIGTSNTRDLR